MPPHEALRTTATAATHPTRPHLVSLADVTPGVDVVIEALAPPMHDGTAPPLHEGQVVHCRARGAAGVVLDVPTHGQVVVPDGPAQATWVRLPPDADESAGGRV